MIIDRILFDSLPRQSNKLITCKCDHCGIVRQLKKFQIVNRKIEQDDWTICKSCAIRNFLRAHPIPPRKTIPKKYSKTEWFFTNPNLINSYWAGFIAADGNVTYGIRKRAILTIALHRRDRHVIERFISDTEYTGQISDKIYNERLRSTVCVHSAHQWLKDLDKNWRITPKKTLTLRAPLDHGPTNNLAFIIGYIDGDGCFFHSQNKLGLKIVGTKAILEWIKDIIDRLSGINGPSVHKCCWANAYQYIVKRESTLRCLAIHTSPLSVRSMDRKWQKLWAIL